MNEERNGSADHGGVDQGGAGKSPLQDAFLHNIVDSICYKLLTLSQI
jgi:hypothetical protein